MKTVILGCGYIGMALASHWQQESHTLVATTTREERRDELKALVDEVWVVDGSNQEALAALLDGADRLVVCVAPKRGGDYESTYLKTAYALRDVLCQGTTLKQLVYTSATSVYGDRQGEWVTEESPLQPDTPNGEILCKTEAVYLNDLPKEIVVSVLRLGGIYGPGREHEMRVRRMAGSTYPGSGGQFCNWVHQEDIVRAIDWVFKRELSGVYNLCSDDHPTRDELYRAITTELALPAIIWNPSEVGVHSGNKRVSNQKITSTGFVFRYSCQGPVATSEFH